MATDTRVMWYILELLEGKEGKVTRTDPDKVKLTLADCDAPGLRDAVMTKRENELRDGVRVADVTVHLLNGDKLTGALPADQGADEKSAFLVKAPGRPPSKQPSPSDRFLSNAGKIANRLLRLLNLPEPAGLTDFQLLEFALIKALDKSDVIFDEIQAAHEADQQILGQLIHLIARLPDRRHSVILLGTPPAGDTAAPLDKHAMGRTIPFLLGQLNGVQMYAVMWKVFGQPMDVSTFTVLYGAFGGVPGTWMLARRARVFDHRSVNADGLIAHLSTGSAASFQLAVAERELIEKIDPIKGLVADIALLASDVVQRLVARGVLGVAGDVLLIQDPAVTTWSLVTHGVLSPRNIVDELRGKGLEAVVKSLVNEMCRHLSIKKVSKCLRGFGLYDLDACAQSDDHSRVACFDCKADNRKHTRKFGTNIDKHFGETKPKHVTMVMVSPKFERRKQHKPAKAAPAPAPTTAPGPGTAPAAAPSASDSATAPTTAPAAESKEQKKGPVDRVKAREERIKSGLALSWKPETLNVVSLDLELFLQQHSNPNNFTWTSEAEVYRKSRDPMVITALSFDSEAAPSPSPTQTAADWPIIDRPQAQEDFATKYLDEQGRNNGNIVLIKGVRRVGKSILVRRQFPNGLFLNFSENCSLPMRKVSPPATPPHPPMPSPSLPLHPRALLPSSSLPAPSASVSGSESAAASEAMATPVADEKRQPAQQQHIATTPDGAAASASAVPAVRMCSLGCGLRATVHCVICKAIFCDDCNTFEHEGDKATHRRRKL